MNIIPAYLYHVSCADNHNSIMKFGLVPGVYTGFEETPSEYVYLGIHRPDKKFKDHILRNNIVEEYLLLRSAEYDTCPKFNLYKVKAEGLDFSLFSKTNDYREIRYSGIIPPENIKFMWEYNTRELNEIFQSLNI